MRVACEADDERRLTRADGVADEVNLREDARVCRPGLASSRGVACVSNRGPQLQEMWAGV